MKFRLLLAVLTAGFTILPCLMFRHWLRLQERRVAQACTTVTTIRIHADGTQEQRSKNVGCVDKDGNWFNPRTGEGF